MASVENYVPYQPNAQGLTEALLDLKSTMPSQVVAKVTGYVTNCFEDVTQGDAVYSRASDGFIGKAIANDTEHKAQVAGFAETTKSSGSEVRVYNKRNYCYIWIRYWRFIFFISCIGWINSHNPSKHSWTVCNKSW